MEYKTPTPCDKPRPDHQDAADYPDEPRQCVCGWLLTSHDAYDEGKDRT